MRRREGSSPPDSGVPGSTPSAAVTPPWNPRENKDQIGNNLSFSSMLWQVSGSRCRPGLLDPQRSPVMNRMTVLIALVGLALFVGCNQTDGSGSEWICAEGRVGNPNEQDWQCYSQTSWQQCSFKYVCEDAAEEEWFCDKLGTGRKYNETCADQYICEDQAGHYWACDSEDSQADCENELFRGSIGFLSLQFSRPKSRSSGVLGLPRPWRQFASSPPNFRQIKVQTLEPRREPHPLKRLQQKTLLAILTR